MLHDIKVLGEKVFVTFEFAPRKLEFVLGFLMDLVQRIKSLGPR